MKITFAEYDGCFCFDLTAEDIKDAALLARAAMNTKLVKTDFTKEGVISATLVMHKPKERLRRSQISRPNFNNNP